MDFITTLENSAQKLNKCFLYFCENSQAACKVHRFVVA